MKVRLDGTGPARGEKIAALNSACSSKLREAWLELGSTALGEGDDWPVENLGGTRERLHRQTCR